MLGLEQLFGPFIFEGLDSIGFAIVLILRLRDIWRFKRLSMEASPTKAFKPSVPYQLVNIAVVRGVAIA